MCHLSIVILNDLSYVAAVRFLYKMLEVVYGIAVLQPVQFKAQVRWWLYVVLDDIDRVEYLVIQQFYNRNPWNMYAFSITKIFCNTW